MATTNVCQFIKNAYAIYNHLEDVNNQKIVYIRFTMLTLILISLSSTCMKNKYSFQMKCSVKSLIKSLLSAVKLFTFKNKTVDLFICL